MRRIYLVDDDKSLLRALGRMLCVEGFEVVPFESPKSFLRTLSQTTTGCVIADLKMPEMSGIEMYEAMEQAGSALPIIFLTGQGAIPDCALAMKLGAVNFLVKPAAREDLLGAIDEAFRLLEAAEREDSEKAEFRRRFASLTPREQEVCIKVTEGLLNKQIAGDLEIAEKTIKIHRARVMEKMRANSVAGLVRMVDRVKENGRASRARNGY
jgi:FixJ family two-component response regulator